LVDGRPTVLVADDHPPTRRILREVLEDDGFDVVATPPDGRSAVGIARNAQPDICILDINMPGDGTEAARSIVRELPDTVVVMLTVSTSDEDLFAALRAGARGYLVKGGDPAAMIARLRTILSGEPALSEGLTMRIIDQFAEQRSRQLYVAGRGFVTLSVREADVLEALRLNLRTDQIARRLDISPGTVRTHVSALLRKLGVRNRAEAVELVEAARDQPE
jgi:two-component system, NarL family, nitrate/nitrite response regulator NarL